MLPNPASLPMVTVKEKAGIMIRSDESSSGSGAVTSDLTETDMVPLAFFDRSLSLCKDPALDVELFECIIFMSLRWIIMLLPVSGSPSSDEVCSLGEFLTERHLLRGRRD